MGLFSNIREAKIFERGQFFPHPGHFVCDVAVMKYQENRKRDEALIGEFTVVESDHAEVKPGDRRDWYLGKRSDYFDSDLLGFLVAMFGLVPGPRDNAAIEEWKRADDRDPLSLSAISGDMCDKMKQSLQGMRIRLETTPHKTKEKQVEITRYHWRPWYQSKAEAIEVYRRNLARGPLTSATQGAPPPPPPAGDPRLTWQRSPDGLYVLNPAVNAWEPAPR